MLNLNEVKALAEVINVATERGAWKAAELYTVGLLFQRLNVVAQQLETEAREEAENAAANAAWAAAEADKGAESAEG